jgi:hypothetical protein
MTAVEPASQAVFETVARLSHITVTVELLPSAVTVNVPEPLGPVSQVNAIVSGPAGVAAKAVDEIAMTAPPAASAARADFNIDMMALLSLQSRPSGKAAL